MSIRVYTGINEKVFFKNFLTIRKGFKYAELFMYGIEPKKKGLATPEKLPRVAASEVHGSDAMNRSQSVNIDFFERFFRPKK